MAFKLANLEPRNTTFVLIFDPKDLTEVHLDPIRRNSHFDVLMSSSEPQALLLKSEARSVTITIQPTRLELVQELKIPFKERGLSELRELLQALPELGVKSFGLNYTVFFSIKGFPSGGQYIRERFLKQPTGLDDVLDGPVLSNSTRILFGSPEEYRDVRFTPPDVRSEVVILQYHYHREEQVRDRERTLRVIHEQYETEVTHIDALMEKL